MAEPKAMIATAKQPIGWPTHRYQHCLKTVMPSKSIGTSMKLHRNIPKELLPNAPFGKLPARWRTNMLPPVGNPWHPAKDTEQSQERNDRQEQDEVVQHRSSNSRAAHYDVRPPSAYSESIILKPSVKSSDWVRNRKLDTAKLRALMRENTFYPGNFSTLCKPSKERVGEMVNRLSYDPYERREQLILVDNPEGSGDTPMYSKTDIEAIVKRLAITKPAPEPSSEPEKKVFSKELSPKEKEIVDRLSKYEHPADKVTDEKKELKTITKAEVEEMLKRLTQKHERKLPPGQTQVEVRKVSMVDMEDILARLCKYDSEKWPPESKPQIFRLHATDE